jgi:hypothetical protein
MKKNLFSLLLLSLSFFSVSAQFEIGLKAGLNSTNLTTEGIIINSDDGNGIQLNFRNSDYGYQFGLYTRLSVASVFIEPNLLFSSNKVDYQITDLGSPEVLDIVRNETYNYLDIPVFVGFKAGILKIQGGPVAHLFIDSASELLELNGYEQNFKEASYGWQAGIGLDLWKFRFEVNYEGNFSKYGEHITVNGFPYQFDDSANRIIINAGFRF